MVVMVVVININKYNVSDDVIADVIINKHCELELNNASPPTNST